MMDANQQWVYTVDKVYSYEPGEFTELCNERGIDGWELVSVHASKEHDFLFFKRPRNDELQARLKNSGMVPMDD